MTKTVKIKVIGVGDAGINIVNYMMINSLTGVEFWVMNTDVKLLNISDCENKLQLGANTLNGLSTEGNIHLGEKAAEESYNDIKNTIKGADMVFIVAGFGGGTGTATAPVIAKIAKEMGILTIAIVSKPYTFEGVRCQKKANIGIKELKEVADAIAVISNDKLLHVADREYSIHEAFSVSDEIFFKFVQNISDITTLPEMINIEFDDLKKVLQNADFLSIGTGQATGENKVAKATRMAINSKLSDHTINEAKSIIVNIKGNSSLTIAEVSEVSSIINYATDKDTTVIIGTTIDDTIQDKVQISIIATGFAMERGDIK